MGCLGRFLIEGNFECLTDVGDGDLNFLIAQKKLEFFNRN